MLSTFNVVIGSRRSREVLPTRVNLIPFFEKPGDPGLMSHRYGKKLPHRWGANVTRICRRDLQCPWVRKGYHLRS